MAQRVVRPHAEALGNVSKFHLSIFEDYAYIEKLTIDERVFNGFYNDIAFMISKLKYNPVEKVCDEMIFTLYTAWTSVSTQFQELDSGGKRFVNDVSQLLSEAITLRNKSQKLVALRIVVGDLWYVCNELTVRRETNGKI
jgi:hypothetical protein